ncbi:MAG: glycosyl hydrolase-related protein, partial [Candidatus Thorarchaeota archaeon]
ITLLRCIEWLSRNDFVTRMSHAGPGYNTPNAQCFGKHRFELSIITVSRPSWLDSEIHMRGKEFNNPLKSIFPVMVKSPIRTANKVFLSPSGIVSYSISAKSMDKYSFLPPVLSFLAIDNKNVVLSALKKSEKGDYLIIRVYNISSTSQKASLTFFDKLSIKNVNIVNFLEEAPEHEIKAKIISFKKNMIEIVLEPHVITTFHIKLELIE